jgi:hypothetical protein
LSLEHSQHRLLRLDPNVEDLACRTPGAFSIGAGASVQANGTLNRCDHISNGRSQGDWQKLEAAFLAAMRLDETSTTQQLQYLREKAFWHIDSVSQHRDGRPLPAWQASHMNNDTHGIVCGPGQLHRAAAWGENFSFPVSSSTREFAHNVLRLKITEMRE